MLKLENVNMSYGDVQVLWDVSFEVKQGEIVVLVGANGAGKTSTIKTISGLQKVSSGNIIFDNQDMTTLPASDIIKTGLVQVPEGRRLFNEMTVEENLIMGSLHGRAKEKRWQGVEESYSLFPRLKERRKQLAGTLSGGEQQMLAVARGLMSQPKLLMLDEPLSGLNKDERNQMLEFLFKLKNYLYYGIIWLLAPPWVVYILPIFKIVSGLGLLDTHILMIMLYGFSGIPLFSWLALPFMHTFPNELIDAGRLDGCSEWGIVWRIVMPSLKNALIALFILRFVWAYNDLLYSLSFTFHRAKMVMPAILEFPGFYETPFAKMAAGGLLAVLPILLIVIIFQKYVVSGLTGRTLK